MSKENKNQSSDAPKNEEDVGIERVQDLLHAAQRSLGGTQDKYQVLETEFKQQQAELSETKNENAKLKKKLQKLLNKISAVDETPKSEKEESEVVSVGHEDGNRTSWLREVYLNRMERIPPKLIRGKPSVPHAFCVLVMNRDVYALGAAVLAHRLRRLNSKADIVCMVTRDVSLGVVEALATEFNAVFQVPYLEYKCRKMTTKKQQKYYGHWIERSFTKWNVLALTMYKKVVLLDADLLPVSNIDHLFEMSAPAATFSSPWARTYRRDGFDDPYKGLRHGDLVDNSKIRDAIRLSFEHGGNIESKGSYVALGSVVLLEPNIASYGSFNAFVCSQQPFGIPGCHSGFDEQSIVLFYYLQNPETKWMHISQGYNALWWHEQWLEGCEIKCYHYFNAKPWELRPDMYPDLKMWYQAVHELIHENSQCGYLSEVCIADKSFLDLYYKMTSSTDDTRTIDKGAAKSDSVGMLKPILVPDRASDESRSSSPRAVDSKSTKPLKANQKSKATSTSSDETTDPPKIESIRSERAMSVCSDGARSTTSSMRSRDSNRAVPHPRSRGGWYDEYGRPLRKDVVRLKDPEDRHRDRRPMAVDVYGSPHSREPLRRKSHFRPELVASDHSRLRRRDPRDYSKPADIVPHSFAASERFLAASANRLSSSFNGMSIDRSSRHHMLSHSPPSHARAFGRFDSFGSSNSSGSYRLTPKHERRTHF